MHANAISIFRISGDFKHFLVRVLGDLKHGRIFQQVIIVVLPSHHDKGQKHRLTGILLQREGKARHMWIGNSETNIID